MKASNLLCAVGLVLAGLMSCPIASAQTVEEPLRYVDALQFRMINKGFADTETPFQRLPKCLKDSASTDLWQRQSCSSGLGIRFATDSKRV
ncbi:MAG: SGNH/GDSL hydrolase N-terminal domain-containing protein, partial [Bacteroidales bacterium]|nr:SGNH/GDSL hydrolase N-terminal domain-containing protein [Bacteroidales bacterium]